MDPRSRTKIRERLREKLDAEAVITFIEERRVRRLELAPVRGTIIGEFSASFGIA